MNTYKWLLKREFWEHKGGFFWAPIVAGAIFLVLSLMGIGAGELAARRMPDHAQINVDGRLLAVAGNSVGGNMAAAVSLMAKAKGARAPCEQLLFWPVATANFETAS